ncbi:acetoacetyl-CoA synthetase [Nephila pilipes]|uniref:Acetoacetyl-CoA synthetase n=1 Tax=Nephila pilipes TaxID=299642 RepID=A0A8X6NW60_NEPPI|nr:acetoacetyl-CoA synthetase [Nephila pilipes]
MGEIVISKPVPNLPLGLWNDNDGSVYREKYFSKYPGIFSLGDCGMINPVTKNWIIYCRSDEALNPKGCRFGPSEIYNIGKKFSAPNSKMMKGKTKYYSSFSHSEPHHAMFKILHTTN